LALFLIKIGNLNKGK